MALSDAESPIEIVRDFDPEALPVPDLGLRCLKCGYYLAELSERRCPECGRPFTMDEHIPRGDFPVVIYGGHEVALTPEIMALMRAAQIPYMEMMRPGDTIYGFGGLTHSRCRLGVPRAVYFHAIELLRRRDAGLLRIDESPADERPEWTCGGCGEENPGNFDVCWQCGVARAVS